MILDRPEIVRVLFHPRRQDEFAYRQPGIVTVTFQVEPGLYVGGRLYPAGHHAPAILYFHGNGEIAADYDGIAPLYTALGITLLVVDYRGYGVSGGRPTSSHLLADAVHIFHDLGNVLAEEDLAPRALYVMGRSLGSAAAIEVARQAGDGLDGLIVESGFADTFALLARLGVRVRGAGEARDGFDNAAKMSHIHLPVLVIHGQDDVLIPASDGEALYSRSAATHRRLVLIPGAGHNDLLWTGKEMYLEAIAAFAGAARRDQKGGKDDTT